MKPRSWILLLAFVLLVVAFVAGITAQQQKVTLCHRPPGNPSNAQTITVGQPAAQSHFSEHPGDTPGPCPGSPKK